MPVSKHSKIVPIRKVHPVYIPFRIKLYLREYGHGAVRLALLVLQPRLHVDRLRVLHVQGSRVDAYHDFLVAPAAAAAQGRRDADAGQEDVGVPAADADDVPEEAAMLEELGAGGVIPVEAEAFLKRISKAFDSVPKIQVGIAASSNNE